MKTVTERLKHFIIQQYSTQANFSRKLKIAPQTVNRWMKKKGISVDNIIVIAQKAPELNITWLITGRGEMLNSGSENAIKMANEPLLSYGEKEDLILEYRKRIESLEETKKNLQGQVEFLQDLNRRNLNEKLSK